MIKLRCLLRYANGPLNLAYDAGTVFDADDAQAAYLLVDAPECFEVVKAITAPARDKMVRTPEADK
ncbi:MAG: hypothetical protein IPM06_19525 [Rhizobiales bacterium]|nr:hypothetical protein [Hyphomicrobiales bacterium]